MNIVLLGPQGSGKGTQAKLLAERFGLYHFEAGEFLREMAKKNESLRKIMDKGNLVPDDEMCSYVTAFFDEKDLYDNVLLDGFPRTLNQYRFLNSWLKDREIKFDLVLVLEISETETLKRLLLRGRRDDTPDSIKKRLALYRERTKALIDEMKKEIEVKVVDGERSIGEIQEDLAKIIDDTYKN